ncbi:protein lin-37 homolog isoform X2 [Littorina saxatilis]|uniref:protein lin-37 homolog isoform X2 n=1 Tax=Littorina saxatilis TaxID=31220 RepID=UPI0038B4DE43
MSGKSKHEVASARFRLDATLQHLVEKKDDGYTGSDGESGGVQPDFVGSASPIQSPRKAGKSRKRKRKDDSADFSSGSQHQTFVMKLFDRSVDLAQFDEESPLYPICRAWIRNQPADRTLHGRERTPTPEPPPQPSTSQDEEGMDDYPDVYRLPEPVKGEYSALTSSCRIPAPLAQPLEKLNIRQDPDHAPPPEQLLLDHMVRWKQIRNGWREAGILNEMRYAGSMDLLRDMFERNMKDG